MRARLVLLAALVAATLSGCEPYAGPTATCFSLLEGPCRFEPLPGPGVGRDG